MVGFASTRSPSDPSGATALVSFVASSSSSPSVPQLLQVISPTLVVRGTVAFSAPADATTCAVEGLVNLETLELF